MPFTRWLRNFQPSIGSGWRELSLADCGRRQPRARLRLETLETRTAPALLTVVNTNDSGPGSLREAIVLAQNSDHRGLDTIAFAIPGDGVLHTISLASALPTITQ